MATYFQFATQKAHRAIHRLLQDFVDREEARLLVGNDDTVGRDGNFTIGKGVERIDRFVGTRAGG